MTSARIDDELRGRRLQRRLDDFEIDDALGEVGGNGGSRAVRIARQQVASPHESIDQRLHGRRMLGDERAGDAHDRSRLAWEQFVADLDQLDAGIGLLDDREAPARARSHLRQRSASTACCVASMPMATTSTSSRLALMTSHGQYCSVVLGTEPAARSRRRAQRACRSPRENA